MAADGEVHRYRVRVRWQGSTAAGYERYDRSHGWSLLDGDGREVPVGDRLSSDPAFRGDPALPNPEQLLVAAAASCQLLSFLAVAARARLDVVAYADEAVGEMPGGDRPVRIETIRLAPVITIAAGDGEVAEGKVRRLVEVAHRECFIASSLRSDVTVEPTVRRR